MSQATLLPSSPVAPSFPPLVYHGVPVLTTEMLAQAYEVEAKQIRQNFANNRERFIEGKHFFQLSGNDLREFKNYVENFDLVQIDKRARHFTLWTERGAARNAKMLNSDRAWDVFELLEETFFRVVRKESESRPLADDMVLPVSPDRPSRRTDPERKQLTAIINTWVSMAPIHYASARAQVNAHFGVASVDALTVAQVREAIRWVQGKIDSLPAAAPTLSGDEISALPPSTVSPHLLCLSRIEEVRELIRATCHPGAVTMKMTPQERKLYYACHAACVAADEALAGAYGILDAGRRMAEAARM